MLQIHQAIHLLKCKKCSNVYIRLGKIILWLESCYVHTHISKLLVCCGNVIMYIHTADSRHNTIEALLLMSGVKDGHFVCWLVLPTELEELCDRR